MYGQKFFLTCYVLVADVAVLAVAVVWFDVVDVFIADVDVVVVVAVPAAVIDNVDGTNVGFIAANAVVVDVTNVGVLQMYQRQVALLVQDNSLLSFS